MAMSSPGETRPQGTPGLSLQHGSCLSQPGRRAWAWAGHGLQERTWASGLLQPPVQMLTHLELATEAHCQEAAPHLGLDESHHDSPVRDALVSECP